MFAVLLQNRLEKRKFEFYGAIAQLASAFAWHARGRGFDSH